MRRGGSALALLLAACGGVVPEQGTQPVALSLAMADGRSGLVSLNECILEQATALLRFDGNLGQTTGDFSTRASWSSSDPAVVAVSNGELPAASGGGSYAAGVLLPRRTGVARVSARYLDFVATLDVEVQPVRLTLRPALREIAERSYQDFDLTITTASGLVATAAEGIAWNIDQATSAARIDAGRVTANAASAEGFTLRAQPVGCDRGATQELKVSAIDHLALLREQPEAVLPLGISELLRVQVHFADATSPPQELAGQVEAEAGDEEVLGIALRGEALQLTGRSEGTSGGTIRYAPEGAPAFSLRLPDYTVQALDVTALRLEPESLRLTYPDSGELTAWARYADGIERPVSRHVVWSSSDGTAIAIGTGGETAATVRIGDRDYSGQAYARFGDLVRAAAVLVYRNEGQ